MKSKTKTSVNHNTVQAMISVAGLGDATSIEELKDGEFNVAFKVKTGDNDYVIKIAPNADADVLTYEKDLMATELAVYDLIAKNTDVRIPKIFYESREINGSPWYVMEFLAAKPLFKMKLTKTQTNNIMFELGVSVAKINAVKNDAFGYIQNGLKTSWKEAYNSMVSAVLSDAKRLNLRVPKLKKILALIEKNANVLEEVATPRLIHFDLWKGNIFVNENMQLEGIIDTERAMWGDLYGEFINLDFLGDFKKNTAFIEGYNSAADEKIVFTGSTEKRMDLMRLYLSLIIFTEADSRLDKTNIAYWFKKVFSRLLMNKAIKGLNK
ncbi:MAG: aminoglycoside phosphotransferase family protein [Eubacteriales bacterium]